MKEIYEPIERNVPDLPVPTTPKTEKLEPISLLVLGIDERENDTGRSDTMVVMTVNPTSASTKLLSIPRDTYTEIVGKDVHDKINHAYSFGGAEMALASTEKLLDISIDYVVQIDMESFVEIVDILGGIDVTNAFSFQTEVHEYPEGALHLSGEQALDYVRMRYDDPNGDFGRQERQKQVMQAVLDKAAEVPSLFKFDALLDTVADHVTTNINYSEVKQMHSNYRQAFNQIDTLQFIKGSGATVDGVWYYMMDDNELAAVSEELKNHLSNED